MKRNLIGQKFNKLEAKSFAYRGRHGLSFYWFACECGNRKILCGTDVSCGKTKSCGCNHIIYNREAHIRLSLGEAAFNILYGAYKSGSKSRGHEFSLTQEEFHNLTQSNCTYCGLPPIKVWAGTNRKQSPYLYNGVDRVNNARGYVSDNVVPCCKVCNQAKHNLSLEEFTEWLDRVVKFRTNTEGPAAQGNEKNL